ncbi:phage baseplate assembly protein V [Brevibacillus humidisoli]|uniref:phage baseplate assembly protein V n=1 Tax=Brevibacillus humidisoli TaxID=2895522 RepID=UPI001E5F5F8D|nr:phage baseplate assembly protein V [Brevibacillus humidisoli]UFJ38950.1 phage baseplate assembly protein V [Brevibacillus humidisoli]
MTMNRQYSQTYAAGQQIDGVLVGTVTDNKDPEGLGRVKLKLPLREDEYETDWVRIATMMAGNDRGSLFIPEVGDEVLVAFHLGKIRQPYVIGMLWNSQQVNPTGDEENNLRKIRSRSGHEITLDDTKDKEKVTILTSKGQKVEMDDAAETITIAGINSYEIVGSKDKVEVKAQQSTVTITTQGEITLSAAKSITLKSMDVNIEANANVNIKGALINVKSDSGAVTIKGTVVKIN